MFYSHAQNCSACVYHIMRTLVYNSCGVWFLMFVPKPNPCRLIAIFCLCVCVCVCVLIFQKQLQLSAVFEKENCQIAVTTTEEIYNRLGVASACSNVGLIFHCIYLKLWRFRSISSWKESGHLKNKKYWKFCHTKFHTKKKAAITPSVRTQNVNTHDAFAIS